MGNHVIPWYSKGSIFVDNHVIFRNTVLACPQPNTLAYKLKDLGHPILFALHPSAMVKVFRMLHLPVLHPRFFLKVRKG